MVFSVAGVIWPVNSSAQVNYVARFSLEKQRSLLGEPVFCVFTLRNTGVRTFAFSYRLPSRVLNRELELEPRFRVKDDKGHAVRDPAPRPCGGAKGSTVYGSVTLPPGQTHAERWLLDEWARFSRPGRYRVRAERRLPLFLDAPAHEVAQRPAAYALAMDDLDFDVVPATETQLEAAFAPFEKTLEGGTGPDFAEAALVVATRPRPFLLRRLEALAAAPRRDQSAERGRALEGLARLGTRPAWEAIAAIARGKALSAGPRPGSSPASPPPAQSQDDSLRAYAVLLLGERADRSSLPVLLEMLSTASEELRGDALRALGFFHDPQANQSLFEKLHSANPTDRVNAILGLKNLESKDALPALMSMLNDSEPRVRQVADFALESLTGKKFTLSPNASRPESAKDAARVSDAWHAWWREQGATFTLRRQPPCHDW